MHIEPGVVDGAKMALSYATAAGAGALAVKMSYDTVRSDGGAAALVLRSVATTALVYVFFQVLPHYPRGVSEVHFIFGATLYLIFGGGPTAIGLALGLLLQGLTFEQRDLPQYFINVTTLLAPLYLVTALAKRIVPLHAPYVGLKYWQVLAMSVAYQGGVIVLVALWSVYGQGFGAANLSGIGVFALNYLVVIVVEPIVALLILAGAKRLDRYAKSPIFYNRLHHPVT